MHQNKYFVQIVDNKGNRKQVQEVAPKMFTFLQNLPQMDTALNEPNLIQLERYGDAGDFHVSKTIDTYYAGVAKVNGHDLVQSFHYFLHIKPTKIKKTKGKPYYIADYAQIVQAATQPKK